MIIANKKRLINDQIAVFTRFLHDLYNYIDHMYRYVLEILPLLCYNI